MAQKRIMIMPSKSKVLLFFFFALFKKTPKFKNRVVPYLIHVHQMKCINQMQACAAHETLWKCISGLTRLNIELDNTTQRDSVSAGTRLFTPAVYKLALPCFWIWRQSQGLLLAKKAKRSQKVPAKPRPYCIYCILYWIYIFFFKCN